MKPAPIPLFIVAGALGSGKSRLINTALDRSDMAGALAFANQAGATLLARSIAADALPASALNDCLCCRRGGFSSFLEGVVRAIDNRRLPAPDRLVFETMADADPILLAGELIGHPYLSKRFHLAGIVVAIGYDTPLPLGADLIRQIESADSVVITGGAPVAELNGAIEAANPAVPVQSTSDAVTGLFAARRFNLSAKASSVRRRFYSRASSSG